jgi:hypothetical protein
MSKMERVLVLFGTLWSAFVLGHFQADSFGFYLEDLPYSLISWLVIGWPGQVVVYIFWKGKLRNRVQASAVSFVVAFLFINAWLAVDERSFKIQHPIEEMDSGQRDRWWPYSQFRLVLDGDPDWGYSYWAI